MLTRRDVTLRGSVGVLATILTGAALFTAGPYHDVVVKEQYRRGWEAFVSEGPMVAAYLRRHPEAASPHLRRVLKRLDLHQHKRLLFRQGWSDALHSKEEPPYSYLASPAPFTPRELNQKARR